MWVRRKRRQCEKATLLARRSGGDRENKGEERQDLKRREDRIGGLEVVFSPFFYLNFELTNVIR